jgi:ribosomal-protein-serine acetyltransferase
MAVERGTGAGGAAVASGWLRSMPPSSIDLGHVRLRRWREADQASLWSAITASLPELEPWMPWAPGYDRDRARSFIDAVPVLWAARSDFLFALVDDADEVLGGHGLHRLPATGTLMIGYWTATAHAGRGLATLAAAALTRAALALPEASRVVIHHDRANHRSAAVPSRLGFRQLTDDGPTERPDETRWVLTRDRLASSRVPVVLAAAGGP